MDKIGRKIKLVLIGERYYSGVVIEEDDNLLTFRDKFNEVVSVGKNSIVSLEVKD